jgi:hypothetical protein
MADNGKEKKETNHGKRDWNSGMRGGPGSGGAVYFLGLIGALIYFLNQATNFGSDITGILKSLVWPAYLIYHLFLFLRI